MLVACTYHPDRQTMLRRVSDGAAACLSCWLEDRGHTQAILPTRDQLDRMWRAGLLTTTERHALIMQRYRIETLAIVKELWT